MTVSSGFFNSVNHDRLYDAEQMSSIFDGIIEDGVYESIGEAFMVTAYPDANDTVIVGTGRAWFDHTWTLNDTQFSITLSPPNTLLGRIDSIVIDVDRRDSVRKNSIILVEGEYAETPVAPTLINEELHKQYPIANIQVDAGVSGPVSQSKITYLVGTDPCPIVTGPLEAFNISNYFQQMESEFEIWFEGVKDILDTNVAMDLQNQINELKNNQTVSDEGEIGDYIIPFTKEVMEVIKNGGANLKVNSIQLSNTAFVPSDPDTSDIYDINQLGGYCDPGPYNQSFILPDGKIFRIIRVPFDDASKIVGFRYKAYIAVEIITPEGVVSTTKSPVFDINANAEASYPTVGTHPYITYIDADEYPVHVLCYEEYYGNNNEDLDFGVYAYYITVTDEGVVSFVLSSSKVSSTTSTSGDWDGFHAPIATPAFLNDNSVIGIQFCKDNSNYLSYAAYKVSKEGTIQYGNLHIGTYGDPSYPLRQLTDVMSKGYYDSSSNVAKFRLIGKDIDTKVQEFSNARYYQIDPNTVNVSVINGNLTIPSNYPFPPEGSTSSISSNQITKKTWNKTFKSSNTSEGTFKPIVLYDSGTTPVSDAATLVQFSTSATDIYLLVNSGSNVRSVFSGKNGISVYGSTTPTSLANSTYLTSDRCIRNKYRNRNINGKVFMLFDSVARYSKGMNENDINNNTFNTKTPDGVYLLTVEYETED